MNRYYYTYGNGNGSDGGGWTEVVAQDMREAHEVFKKHHPCLSHGVLNCADYYTEATFRGTGMREGNFGRKCREVLFSETAQKEGALIRYRFLTKAEDYRPLKDMEKIRMPWWCTAEGTGVSIIVCYLPLMLALHDFWPDAFDIEWEDKTEIEYTDRLVKPDWMPEPTEKETLWAYEILDLAKGIVWAPDREAAEVRVRRHYENYPSYSRHTQVRINVPACDYENGVYEWR